MSLRATYEEAIDGHRYADDGVNPELPVVTGSCPAALARPGVDDILDDIDAMTQAAARSLDSAVIRGYSDELAPSIVAGALKLAAGAGTVGGKLVYNDGVHSVSGAIYDAGDGSYIVYIAGASTPAVDALRSTEWTTLAAIEPALLLCRVTVTSGVVSGLVDLRFGWMAQSGRDLWPAARALVNRLGPGIYTGGASAAGQLSTTYPAVTLGWLGSQGQGILVATKAAQAFTNPTLSGSVDLYAVAAPTSGVEIDFSGHNPPVQFTLVTSGGTAPADSLLLGSGSYNGSGTWASYTPAAGIMAGTKLARSVRCATTAAINVSGDLEAGDAIDGVTLVAGDRVLVKDQAAPAQNGIYVASSSGAASRAADADSDAEMSAGLAVTVREGTANAATLWVLTTNNPIRVGTTSLTFALVGGGADLFTLDGDSGTPQTVSDGDTVTIAGDGLGIETVVGATDTVTVKRMTTAYLGYPSSGITTAGWVVQGSSGEEWESSLDGSGAVQWTQINIGMLSAAPVGGDFDIASIPTGYIYYNTTSRRFCRYTGSAWQEYVADELGTKFGPPVAGAHTLGDRYIDLAGAMWRCTVAGTPGTWLQDQAGRYSDFGGSGAGLGVTANWNGGALLDGYRVWEAASEEVWYYSTGDSRWLGSRWVIEMSHGAALTDTHVFAEPPGYYDPAFWLTLPSSYDYRVDLVSAIYLSNDVYGGTDQWDIVLYSGAGAISTLSVTAQAASRTQIEDDPGTIVDASSNPYLAVYLDTTGTPPSITVDGVSLVLRRVRP